MEHPRIIVFNNNEKNIRNPNLYYSDAIMGTYIISSRHIIISRFTTDRIILYKVIFLTRFKHTEMI